MFKLILTGLSAIVFVSSDAGEAREFECPRVERNLVENDFVIVECDGTKQNLSDYSRDLWTESFDERQDRSYWTSPFDADEE